MDRIGAIKAGGTAAPEKTGTIDIDEDQVKFKACQEVATSLDWNDCFSLDGYRTCVPTTLVSRRKVCAFAATSEMAVAAVAAGVREKVRQLEGWGLTVENLGPMEIVANPGFWARISVIADEAVRSSVIPRP